MTTPIADFLRAYAASGTIRGIYEPGCELFRKRMECAIMIQCAKAAGDV